MRILIIGAGDIGTQLAKRLSLEKNDITIVEEDPKKVKRANEQLDALVIEGHSTSYRTLQKADVSRMDVVCAMTNRDEVNIIACQISKKAGAKTTIARVRDLEYGSPEFVLSPEDMSIDVLIHPEKETADAVVRLIRRSTATDVIEFEDGKIQLMGVRLESDSSLLGTPLLELGKEFGNPPMRIVAIVRNQETLIPRGNDLLVPGDQIFVISDPAYVSEFLTLTGRIMP